MIEFINDQSAEEILKLTAKSLSDKKAFDIKAIDISEVSTIADVFVMASGNNRNQIQAICDEVREKLERCGLNLKHIEGYDAANWILLDFGDLVIHIFDKESREIYSIERIWRDGKDVDLSEYTNFDI